MRTALQLSVKNYIIPPEETISRKNLIGLNEIFKNRDVRDFPTKPPTPNNVPRVKVQSNNLTIFPRLPLHSNDTNRVPRVQPPLATPSPQQTLRRYKLI